MVNVEGALRVGAWERLLPLDYPGRSGLLEGIRAGFHITDRPLEGPAIWQDNYRSATNGRVRGVVERQIREEIDNGRYVVLPEPPLLTSALGAIPKPGTDKIRLIHDCSRPLGSALNDLADLDKYSYQTIREAAALIRPQDYLAKVDLASAYRSVKIHPDDYPLTGLHWTFQGDDGPTYISDTRLPFGAKKSSGIFSALTQVVRHIVEKQGLVRLVAYLDDFLIVGRSYTECREGMNSLIKTLRTLGFSINYNKVEGPTQVLTFLGVEINTQEYTLSLPEAKLNQLLAEVATTLSHKNATKRELQSLVGRLGWAAQVLYGGRAHLRRIIDRINSLQAPHHRSRLTEGVRADLIWWINNVRAFNGHTPISDSRSNTHVCIDACGAGAGGYAAGHWFHVRWADWPGSGSLHINYKEVLALAPAVDLWGEAWRGRRIYVYSDNQAAVGILNRGTAKDPFVMAVLRNIFWKSVFYNFRIYALYYPGYRNVVADAASRLGEAGGWGRLQEALRKTIIA